MLAFLHTHEIKPLILNKDKTLKTDIIVKKPEQDFTNSFQNIHTNMMTSFAYFRNLIHEKSPLF